VAQLILLAALSPITAAMSVMALADSGFLELLVINRVSVTIFAGFTVAAAVGAMRDPPDGWYKWFLSLCEHNVREHPVWPWLSNHVASRGSH